MKQAAIPIWAPKRNKSFFFYKQQLIKAWQARDERKALLAGRLA
jgi:hypothetical protein